MLPHFIKLEIGIDRLEIRTLPKPHCYAVGAPDVMPIKEFYKGTFEEISIFFHPFIKPVSIDYDLFVPDTFQTGTKLRRSVNCLLI